MDMKLLEEIFLDEYINEYSIYKIDYKNIEKELFYKKYKKIVSVYEKSDFLEWDMDEYNLFVLYGLYKKVIFTIDWSGEEYSGQVKKCLNILLKKYGIENMKWQKNIYKNILDKNVKRGEYLPLLFEAFNNDLKKINCVLGFFEMEDDAYYYFILPKNEYDKIKCYDEINDTKLFELYLLPNNINQK
jgi:hypothetical protein